MSISGGVREYQICNFEAAQCNILRFFNPHLARLAELPLLNQHGIEHLVAYGPLLLRSSAARDMGIFWIVSSLQRRWRG
jgi:hypothetical protein